MTRDYQRLKSQLCPQASGSTARGLSPACRQLPHIGHSPVTATASYRANVLAGGLTFSRKSRCNHMPVAPKYFVTGRPCTRLCGSHTRGNGSLTNHRGVPRNCTGDGTRAST